MRTTWLDYLIIAPAITALVAVAALGTWGLSLWVSRPILGPYHVLADLGAFLGIYGLATAGVLAACRRMDWLRPGEYPMDHPAFTRWKFYAVLQDLGQAALSPLFPVFARPALFSLLGARIGRQVAVGGELVDPFLVRIGDGAVVGLRSALVGHAITSGRIVLAPVTVGPRATVGVHTVVMPGVDIGEGAVILPGSVVPRGTRIGPGEVWGGVPARPVRTKGRGGPVP